MKQLHVLRAMLSCVLLTGSAVAAAQGASTQRYTTNYKDADIATVTEAVANATGKTFILDPRVRAQVNLISSVPMTANEFYQAYLSILQVHGFAAVPTGNIVKIVPDANVRTVPGNDLPATINAGSDELVTQVITARNINAAQLAQVLRPLIAQYGNIAPVPGTNTLIITDRASNVARIMRIVNRVDQSGDANIEVIPLQNSSASDVVRTLNSLTTGQAAPEGAGAGPRVVADERSNSILVSGDSAQRLRIATLIAHLDTPVESGGGTEVIFLRYAEAEKIEKKLKEQMAGTTTATGPAGGTATVSTNPADRNVIIWSEPETNALVITAPPKTLRSLRSIIERIDIRRAQVQVEAIIVDVSTDKSADLGVNWAVYDNGGNPTTPAGVFNSPVGNANNSPVGIIDLARAIQNPGTATTAPTGATIGFGRLVDSGLSWAAMIRALRADANANVIATPTVTTMDNQEAELKNAQEVPFITGQYASTNSGANPNINPFTTVNREEVGLILKVTPQITNEGDTLVMKIDLESSELSNQSGDAGSLITLKRAVKTNVLIEDGGTIVIGGLIRDADINGEQRVPFLGRIPLLGEAFRTRSGKRAQTNLMIFIRPKILADGFQSAVESNAKYNQIRELQKKMNSKMELIPLMPGVEKPQLPEPPPLPEGLEPRTIAPANPPASPTNLPAPAQPAPAAPAQK